MLQPSIIKICVTDPWLFTFDLLDPYSNTAITQESTFATYSLYDSPVSTTALWSGDWERGIEADAGTAGRIHVRVPESISKYLQPGLYTYRIELVSREHLTYSKKVEGTLEAVPSGVIPEAILGETDPIARELISNETKRALQAEEDIRGRMRPGPDGSTYIPDGGITTNKIADGAVTVRKLDDGVIPLSKIDPLAIADIDNVASALLPRIQIGTVVSGDDFHIAPRIEAGTLFLDFTLVPGTSPEISNGNTWVIGDTDTQVPVTGEDGIGVDHVELIDESEGVNTYRMFFSRNGTLVDYTYDFQLNNPGSLTSRVQESIDQPISSGGVYSQLIRNQPQPIYSTSKLPLTVVSPDFPITSGYITSAFNLDTIGTPLTLWDADSSADTVCSRITDGGLDGTSIQYHFDVDSSADSNTSHISSFDFVINNGVEGQTSSGIATVSQYPYYYFLESARATSISQGSVQLEILLYTLISNSPLTISFTVVPASELVSETQQAHIQYRGLVDALITKVDALSQKVAELESRS